ncbi:elastin-like [Hyalella azteca]|uniref:Elastin-like n=1 Tax=Hyalella azteca TaxID=294128 RepID=A0A8B7N9J5_HYAAZ|nr:elastin-like [Hyalella azteca]
MDGGWQERERDGGEGDGRRTEEREMDGGRRRGKGTEGAELELEDSAVEAKVHRRPEVTSGRGWDTGILGQKTAELSSSRPAVTVPTVTVPAVTVPAVTVPTVTVPAVTVPAVAVPAVTVPAVTVPAVTVPAVAVPAVTVPAVAVPAVAMPAVTVPAVAVPASGSLWRATSAVLIGEATPRAPSCATCVSMTGSAQHDRVGSA